MSIAKFSILIFLAISLISCERNENDIYLTSEPVYIPDIEFLYHLIWNGVDTNKDSIITYKEAAAIEFLNLSSYCSPDITDITGIEAFPNLMTLVCRCNKIDTMDLSMNKSLREVYAYDNNLKFLDVSGCTELYYLHVGTEGLCLKNRLTSIDISNNKHLRTLYCGSNLLKELDISNNPEFEVLKCPLNLISKIDLSKSHKLDVLEIWGNQLSSIDVSKCSSLSVLDFSLNQIFEVTLENNINLIELDVSRNPLTTLDISQNTSLKLLIIKNMPFLESVCVWTSPFPPPGLNIASSDGSNILFTSNCNR